MSPELTGQQEAEAAHKADAVIREALARGRDALWSASEALWAFNEIRGWLALGHESLNEWLADPELNITSGTYYRLVKTWDKLVVQRSIAPAKLKQLDQSKVAIVVGSIEKGELPSGETVTIEEALEDAKTLGARDLRDRYYGAKPEKAEPVPNVGEHEDEDEDDEDEAEPEDEQGIDSSAVAKTSPEGSGHATPLALHDLVALAQKRWHRKPDAAEVDGWLEAAGVRLVDVDALRDEREEIEGVLASKSVNPRVSRAALEALRDELWR